MAEPLISKDVRERLYKSLVQYEEDKDIKALVLGMKTILHSLDQISFNVLRYLVFHLRVIAGVKGKFYDPKNRDVRMFDRFNILFENNIRY